jgi:hypothetical protein
MKTGLLGGKAILAAIILTVALVPSAQAKLRRVHVPRQHAAAQTETFTVPKDATIAVGSNHSASLGDLHVGDIVNIGYASENGAWVAHHVADGVVHNAVHSGKNSESKTRQKAASTHAHGIVRSIDLSSGTLTIAKKR